MLSATGLALGDAYWPPGPSDPLSLSDATPTAPTLFDTSSALPWAAPSPLVLPPAHALGRSPAAQQLHSFPCSDTHLSPWSDSASPVVSGADSAAAASPHVADDEWEALAALLSCPSAVKGGAAGISEELSGSNWSVEPATSGGVGALHDDSGDGIDWSRAGPLLTSLDPLPVAPPLTALDPALSLSANDWLTSLSPLRDLPPLDRLPSLPASYPTPPHSGVSASSTTSPSSPLAPRAAAPHPHPSLPLPPPFAMPIRVSHAPIVSAPFRPAKPKPRHPRAAPAPASGACGPPRLTHPALSRSGPSPPDSDSCALPTRGGAGVQCAAEGASWTSLSDDGAFEKVVASLFPSSRTHVPGHDRGGLALATHGGSTRSTATEACADDEDGAREVGEGERSGGGFWGPWRGEGRLCDTEGGEIPLLPSIDKPLVVSFDPALDSWLTYRRNFLALDIKLDLPPDVAFSSLRVAPPLAPCAPPREVARLEASLTARALETGQPVELLQFDAARVLRTAVPLGPAVLEPAGAATDSDDEDAAVPGTDGDASRSCYGSESQGPLLAQTLVASFARVRFRTATANWVSTQPQPRALEHASDPAPSTRFVLRVEVRAVLAPGRRGKEKRVALGGWDSKPLCVRGGNPARFAARSGCGGGGGDGGGGGGDGGTGEPARGRAKRPGRGGNDEEGGGEFCPAPPRKRPRGLPSDGVEAGPAGASGMRRSGRQRGQGGGRRGAGSQSDAGT